MVFFAAAHKLLPLGLPLGLLLGVAVALARTELFVERSGTKSSVHAASKMGGVIGVVGIEFSPEMVKNEVPNKAARHRINRQVPSVPRPTSCLHVCREIVPQAALPVDLCRRYFGRQWNRHPESSHAPGAVPWYISAPSVIAVKSIAPKAAPSWPETPYAK